MSFFSFIGKNLFRHWSRLLFTMLGIAFGITGSIIMLGLSEGIHGTFKHSYANRHIDAVVFERDQFNILSSRIDQNLVAKISAFPEVQTASGVLFDVVKYHKTHLPFYGWPENSPLFKEIKTSGRLPRADHNEVIVGDTFARINNKKIGDTLELYRRAFVIVGIFETNVPLEKSALIISLAKMQELKNENRNKILGINITVKDEIKDPRRLQEFLEKLEQAFPEITAQAADIFAEEKAQFIVMGEKIAYLMVLVTIVAVALGLANSMVTSILERRKLLGFLLAIGWDKKDILAALFIEILVICFLGGALGLAVGFVSTDYIFSMAAINVFTPHWNDVFILKIVGLILATAVVSFIIPSGIIVNLNPIEVIKNE
ncbi:MAG: FtsX-like permease family protein [Candidatus Omnitrophota bacterium]